MSGPAVIVASIRAATARSRSYGTRCSRSRTLLSFHDPKAVGVYGIEVPHLLKTIAGNEFDQIYH